MAPPKATVWEMEPHTKAKHVILQEYLKAWFPILSSWNGRIIYYDGFAGPGVYSNGEEGSPLVALNTAKNHTYPLNAELVFVFVEKDARRVANLESLMKKQTLPNNFAYRIIEQEFETALAETLDFLEKEKQQLAPTFALIDPFGITGLPFDLIKRLLQNDRCEVLITFMDSTIKRFVSELPEQINTLIGNSSASEIIRSSEDRIYKARELYKQSLEEVAKFVRFFEMCDKDGKVIYDLFFATNHPLGHMKMKEAMWKVNSEGLFSFSDGIDPNQGILLSPTPERELAPILWEKFQGQTVLSGDVLEYTNNETAFLGKHAREALKLLESESGYNGLKIEVEDTKSDGKPRRKNTFPPEAVIHFIKRS